MSSSSCSFSSSSSPSQLSPPSVSPKSNLERFLQCVTPVAPSRSLPQKVVSELNSLWQLPGNNEMVEYFTLEDLWKCYDEWSAFGAGTRVQLESGDSIMQYYVPYLSAIQIYSNKSSVSPRNSREYSDAVEFENDLWSDIDSAYDDKLSRSLSNNSSKTWDTISDEDSGFEHETSLPAKDRLGHLYMQYFEICSPYWRFPLSTKITHLAKTNPGLMTLRNVDLSPASWMAVAWYPIYHIPSRVNEKDFSTCFLTFHTLSSSLQDYGNEYEDVAGSLGTIGKLTGCKVKEGYCGGISLPPFGLATHKIQGDLWLNPETSDYERLMFLNSAAESWLKQLNVQHHDYNFFTYHSTV